MATKKNSAERSFREKVLDLIVVEWCEALQCFHFEYMGRVLQKNLITYHHKDEPQRIPVAIAATWEQADQITEDLTIQRRLREPGRVIH